MVDTNIPNQANYQDAQSFEIDIDQIYSKFIVAIDDIRSTNNANKINSSLAINTLNKVSSIIDARAALTSLCDTSLSFQESRCHAFFRIIGFPCCDSSKSKIFNPGFDIINDASRKIDIDYKLNVIKNQIPGFRELSIARETYSIDSQIIFIAQDSIDASTLALSSGRNIRKFISPFTNTQFDDMVISNQQYKIIFDSSVGGIPKKLTEYQDVNGNTPTKLASFKFGHIIKPFLVDPIIDLTINDSSKLIAIPFVPSKNYLKIKDNSFVSRPILEQVIRDRYGINNAAETSGTADKSVLDYIKSIPNVTDVEIINSATDLYKLDDQTQFVKFLNIIRAMIKKLIEAQDIIRNVQDNYYWVPRPSLLGPEAGSSVQGVFLSTKISSEFITYNDQKIIDATIKKIISQVDVATSNVNATADVGGFALPNALGIPSIGGSTTSDAFGDNITKNLDQLTSKRNNDLKNANDALRTIEIIMGEFSGLGLCDIIAVLAGLYLMPKDSLLGFLDDDAITRMNSAGYTAFSSNLTKASNDFIAVVKDMYNLMDKIYEDMSQNNGIA